MTAETLSGDPTWYLGRLEVVHFEDELFFLSMRLTEIMSGFGFQYYFMVPFCRHETQPVHDRLKSHTADIFCLTY